MQVYLIRHPKPDVPAGVCYGQSDVPLAESPADVAARLRPLLPTHFALYASPLQRARRLAEALGTPVVDTRLQELSFGEWELRRFDDIGVTLWGEWERDPLNFRAPGGESLAELGARMTAWWQEVWTTGAESVVVVAHGGPLRAWLGERLGMPPARWAALAFECGQCTRVDVADWGVVLRWMNR